jgi:hypothetical protein
LQIRAIDPLPDSGCSDLLAQRGRYGDRYRLATSGRVRFSGTDAVSFGSWVIVPEECVVDVAEIPFIANLQDIGWRCADAVDLAACLKQIAQLPRSNGR